MLYGTESNVQFLKDVMMKFDLMLSLGSEQNNEYLIPCMLPSQDIDMYGQEPFTNMVLIYNTTLKPNQGDAMPVGAFHKLLSQCSKIPSWKVCANDHLSYTDASIEISHGIRLALTLMKTNTIRLSIWSAREVLDDGHLSNNEARELILKAHTTVSQCLKLLALTSSAGFKMLCPHWSPGEEYLCLVTVGEKENIPLDGPVFFAKSNKCTIHKKVLESGHFPWTREELDVDFDGRFKFNRQRKDKDQTIIGVESRKFKYKTFQLYVQQEITYYNLSFRSTYFLETISYNFVAMSGTLETKNEAVTEMPEWTDKTEEVTRTVLSLLDIVMGMYFLSVCCLLNNLFLS